MTRVRSQGHLRVKFNIVTKDMKKLGYDCLSSGHGVPNAITAASIAANGSNQGAGAAGRTLEGASGTTEA